MVVAPGSCGTRGPLCWGAVVRNRRAQRLLSSLLWLLPSLQIRASNMHVWSAPHSAGINVPPFVDSLRGDSFCRRWVPPQRRHGASVWGFRGGRWGARGRVKREGGTRTESTHCQSKSHLGHEAGPGSRRSPMRDIRSCMMPPTGRSIQAPRWRRVWARQAQRVLVQPVVAPPRGSPVRQDCYRASPTG